ncbi:siderophore-interacting protein [Chitinimonas arctica]|uniref:Siderophore-interacting protein n=1 Tax=Chitinimonas arctica TaxID=2594795 RepID=A0A516SK19_9NEIS|nr:siderophore-interacting protein [Chitinimonas arctica]QDQ28494.1 siderophore-interacting protein [Chitinimonas arctica]
MANTSRVRPRPHLLRVRRIRQLSPQMRRITLVGEGLAGFPADCEGAHIKLMLARPHQADPLLPVPGPEGLVWPAAEDKPITRTYTVARFDSLTGEMDVDFVLHGDDGPASRWASAAQAGDSIGLAGPSGPARYRPGAAWYLLLGDPSSLAAVAAVLRALPEDAVGHALIEVPAASEIQPLTRPPGISLQWLSRDGAAAASSTLLLTALRQLDWLDGMPSVTLAGESKQVVALHAHLLTKGVPRTAMYAVPYWKERCAEEAYQEERYQIMDEMDEAADAVRV